MTEASAAPQPKITPRQKRFIDAYVGEARFNASEAARLAGYSPKTAGQQGYDLKNLEHIRARIDAILAAETLNDREILHELTDVAMRGLHEFIEITRYDKEGNPVAAKMDASAKMKALELLGKHNALFTDNVQHGGGIDIQLVGVDLEQL